MSVSDELFVCSDCFWEVSLNLQMGGARWWCSLMRTSISHSPSPSTTASCKIRGMLLTQIDETQRGTRVWGLEKFLLVCAVKDTWWSGSLRAQIQSFMQDALVRFNLPALSLCMYGRWERPFCAGHWPGPFKTWHALLLATLPTQQVPSRTIQCLWGLKFEGVRITVQTLSLHIPDM